MQGQGVLPLSQPPRYMYPTSTVLSPPSQQHQSPSSSSTSGYKGKASVVLGALQVTVGILCFVFQAAAIFVRSAVPSGAGLACGILIIICGSFGIAAGKKKTKCPIVTFMVLSILSSGAVLSMLALSAISIGIDSNDYNNDYYIPHHYDYDHHYNAYEMPEHFEDDYLVDSNATSTTMDTPTPYQYRHYDNDWYAGPVYTFHADRVAVNAVLVALGLFEMVIAICSSAICCAGLCCTGTPRNRVLCEIPVQYVVGNQTPFLLVQQPGQVAYQQVPFQGLVLPQSSVRPEAWRMQQPVNAWSTAPPPAYSALSGESPAATAAASAPATTLPDGSKKNEEAQLGEAYNPHT